MHNTALVVNGHQSERDELHYFLMQAGYSVLPSETSDEALALCRDYKRKIDLLVTDSDLPGTSGWELAERAAALRPGIVILYLSANSSCSDTSQFPCAQSYVPGTEAFRKATMVRDVTEALIQKQKENPVIYDGSPRLSRRPATLPSISNVSQARVVK